MKIIHHAGLKDHLKDEQTCMVCGFVLSRAGECRWQPDHLILVIDYEELGGEAGMVDMASLKDDREAEGALACCASGPRRSYIVSSYGPDGDDNPIENHQ